MGKADGVRASCLLVRCISALRGSGIAGAEKEAEIILTAAIGIDRVSLYRDDPVISEEEMKKAQEIIGRRRRREPLQYIMGCADFFGLRFEVGPGVLVPRPETELLAEEVIRRALAIDEKGAVSILDLCTGSGCIALAAAKRLPHAAISGTDISGDALDYAHRNKEHHKADNVTFLRGGLFEPVGGMRFDIIVSNPPYVRSKDIDGLEPEVKDWEPRGALDGDEDGLKYHREILKAAPSYLKEKGVVMLEIADGQAASVGLLSSSAGFRDAALIRDYAGLERVMVFEWNF
ncbi:MAG: peptide chain release factor N(5)-glutamine methyltransferase [Thermodesulfovibrionales bacterium]|nr:peptide chain release factor N(5)-glutamine methyltransferase [Thermodesulfovibrionales bacterium]